MNADETLALVRRFASKIELSPTGCWLWTGALASKRGGYGKFAVKRDIRPAHRVSYELFVGPIPDGYHMDHLCRVPRCVNPFHLETVTKQENDRRRDAARTHCRRGSHPVTPENTWTRPCDGVNFCRPCKSDREREFRDRRKAAA